MLNKIKLLILLIFINIYNIIGKPDCCANLKNDVKKANNYYCQIGGNAASCANADWSSGQNNIQKFCQCLTRKYGK
uniref:Uncharacterized protein n=1 Tax=Meloidogyne enterolobii TaxID=390850 RepID=A0A6V7X5A1_MELEN|nr:unnamed protein product [Meloidogyne enterolobii]